MTYNKALWKTLLMSRTKFLKDALDRMTHHKTWEIHAFLGAALLGGKASIAAL